MRAILITIGIAVIGVWSPAVAMAVDLVYGCCNRPACGKVCKLVCEPTKLTAVGYGSECKEICIPGPSREGCKHCETRCCCDDDIKGCRPKMEFCWHDWLACGCARPRTVHVLTKYQAEKKVPFYHWEVVDGCNCCGPGGCHCVYKPAPEQSQVGDVLELSGDEQLQVANYFTASETASEASEAPAAPVATNDAPKPTTWQRMAKALPFANDAE